MTETNPNQWRQTGNSLALVTENSRGFTAGWIQLPLPPYSHSSVLVLFSSRLPFWVARAHILPDWHPYRKWFSKVFKQKLWKFLLAGPGSFVPPMLTTQGMDLSITWAAWTRRLPKGNGDIDIKRGGHGPWAGKCSKYPSIRFLWLRILFPITALCPVFLE